MPCLLYSIGVCGVNHINQSVVSVYVVGPILPKRLLSSDIPEVELDLIVTKVLDVESLRGSDIGDILHRKETTSLERVLRMVVFPALSRPRTRILTSSALFFLRFLRMLMSPPCVAILVKFQL